MGDGNIGSLESHGKELAEVLTNHDVNVTSLFIDKSIDGEVNHEYQYNIGDNGPSSLCYETTLQFYGRIS